jgi:hypothetical protein
MKIFKLLFVAIFLTGSFGVMADKSKQKCIDINGLTICSDSKEQLELARKMFSEKELFTSSFTLEQGDVSQINNPNSTYCGTNYSGDRLLLDIYFNDKGEQVGRKSQVKLSSKTIEGLSLSIGHEVLDKDIKIWGYNHNSKSVIGTIYIKVNLYGNALTLNFPFHSGDDSCLKDYLSKLPSNHEPQAKVSDEKVHADNSERSFGYKNTAQSFTQETQAAGGTIQ